MRITAPDVGTTLAGDITFTATPSDYIHGEYTVYFYYRPVGEEAWIFIGMATKQADGAWEKTWDTRSVANGDYEIKLRAFYYDLNDKSRDEYSLPVVYRVDNEPPDITNLEIVAWPERPEVGPRENYLSPDEDGWEDIAKISFTVSNKGYTEVNVYDQDQVLVRTIFAGAANPDSDGLVRLEWDGRNDSRRVVPNGYYTIIVSTDAVAKQASATVLVDKMPDIQNYRIWPNPFSPDGDGIDDTAMVSFNLSEDAYVNVSVETPSGDLVKTLAENEQQARGKLSYVWDGTGNDSASVSQGRYTVRIQGTALTGNIGMPVTLDVFQLPISQIRTITGWAESTPPEGLTGSSPPISVAPSSTIFPA